MRFFLALVTLCALYSSSLGGLENLPPDVLEEEGITLPPDVLDPAQRTIVCANGQYINGVRQSVNEPEYVNCTATRSIAPACQVKVEQRGSRTVVWKHCKTALACARNAARFNPRDCHEVVGNKGFRICVSCCDFGFCNDGEVSIEEVAAYSRPDEVEEEEEEGQIDEEEEDF